MLTEAEIARSVRRLFAQREIGPETFDRAEKLLEKLKPESPLRHRLMAELDELRQLHLCKH